MRNGIINFKIVFKIISRSLFILSGALLVSAVIGILFSEKYLPFVLSSFIAFVLGMVLFLFTEKGKNHDSIYRKDAYLTVALSWVVVSLTGCLPYIFSGSIPSLPDAVFESASGFTTTGSSILVDIEALPKSILFWRSMTHWIGGIGIIVLVILVMPSLQIGGTHLFSLESSLQEKIQPKIKSVGIRLLWIYIGLTLSETALLLVGDMNLFESVCHAFGTISTGGFSPKNTSIGGYSAYIQYIIMIFMLLSAASFVIHYYLIKREFHKVRENEELKFYLFVTFLIGLVITSILFFKMQKPFEESFREGFFQVISIVTCTGYVTADYLVWPEYAWLIIFFAMFLGGCTGSTAGGIKMVRHLIFFKNIVNIFKKLISPKAIIPLWINNKVVGEDTNASILSYMAIYIITFLVGSLLLIFAGIDGKTAFSSVATCMANIGPGIGTVGPASNFAHLPDICKIILSFIMIVGRLEILTILVLFSGNFWRK